MKKKRLNTKLNLKKEKISNLNNVKGGGEQLTYTQMVTCCYDFTCLTCYGVSCPAEGRHCDTDFCQTSQGVSEMACCPC